MSKTIIDRYIDTIDPTVKEFVYTFFTFFRQTCYKGDLPFRNGLFVPSALVVMDILCTNFMNLIIFHHASPKIQKHHHFNWRKLLF